MVRAATGLLLLACISVAAQTPSAFLSRLGRPHTQQFRIPGHILVSIEYDTSGHVMALQIGSSGEPARSTAPMDSQAVDAVLQMIAPGIMSGNGKSIMAVMSRISDLQTTYNGCHLSRQYLWTGGRNDTVAVTLTGLPQSCFDAAGDVAFALQKSYGLPEYQQFSTRGNIDVGVMYKANGSLARIDFDPYKHLVENPSNAAVLNPDVLERFIGELAPAEAMVHATRHVVWNGLDRTQLVVAENLSITRKYKDDVLVHCSIAWR